ncbi:hypothetical protein PAXRUDRAFT_9219 [Paxillus rubicundulus Ve08.2h10]|uniref:Uncharacterized protein n=1 Tax=Paxillus rubicundulus Ve08.2h10 TaxID=930991 RepID=A0A0D0E3W5_9AGAM|nr:hypothetical protein PAXRUDRAFT_9219 [Paxillus rubicundulus Ve08.2h10]
MSSQPWPNWSPTSSGQRPLICRYIRTFTRPLSDPTYMNGLFHPGLLGDTCTLIWGKALVSLLCEVTSHFWRMSRRQLHHIKDRSGDPTLRFLCGVVPKLFNLRSAVHHYPGQVVDTLPALDQVPWLFLVWFLHPLHRLLKQKVVRDLSFLPKARRVVHELLSNGVTNLPTRDTLKCLQALDTCLDNVLNDPQTRSQPQLHPSVENSESGFETMHVKDAPSVLSRILNKLIHRDGSFSQELAEDLTLPLSLLFELKLENICGSWQTAPSDSPPTLHQTTPPIPILRAYPDYGLCQVKLS